MLHRAINNTIVFPLCYINLSGRIRTQSLSVHIQIEKENTLLVIFALNIILREHLSDINYYSIWIKTDR